MEPFKNPICSFEHMGPFPPYISFNCVLIAPMKGKMVIKYPTQRQWRWKQGQYEAFNVRYEATKTCKVCL